MPEPLRNVILVGFMGTGKSTVGKLVARTLGFRFVDTDEMIVRKAGKRIPAIFEEVGEEGFRRIESGVLEDLVHEDGLVVSTGGGIVCGPGNIERMHQFGRVVWLTASEETIWRRVSRNRSRPLLDNENPRETIHRLLEARREMYEKASHLTVGTDDLTAHEVAFGVVESVRLGSDDDI